MCKNENFLPRNVMMDASTLPKLIAHRGASKLAPENTLSAISTAIQLGVDYVEIDVRLSKENIPVVIHDSSLMRTGGSLAFVDRSSLKQIKSMDAGTWFHKNFSQERIPTLKEVLELQWQKTGLMIELKKCRQSEEVTVRAILEVLSTFSSLPPIIIGSFSYLILKELKKQIDPSSSKLRLIGILEKMKELVHFKKINILHLAIWHKILTQSLVESLIREKIEVWSFTVDDEKTAKSLTNWGVSGIISNSPNELFSKA